jgi:hypothetical protein
VVLDRWFLRTSDPGLTLVEPRSNPYAARGVSAVRARPRSKVWRI